MSKHSFTYNLNQRKYSLKFIIYLFILFDILLFYYVPFSVLFIVVTWELSVFIGLLIGLRGQARYRELVWELIAIRRDPKFNNKEELRGHRLARHIDHACMEYDIWFEESKSKINKKKTKNFRGGDKRLMIDEVIKKQIGYAIVGIWGLFGPVIFWILGLYEFSLVLMIFFTGTWEIIDVLILFYIHYIFNIEPIIIDKEEILKTEINRLQIELANK